MQTLQQVTTETVVSRIVQHIIVLMGPFMVESSLDIPISIWEIIAFFARASLRFTCKFPKCSQSLVIYDQYKYTSDHRMAHFLGYIRMKCLKGSKIQYDYYCLKCVDMCENINKAICSRHTKNKSKLCTLVCNLATDIEYCTGLQMCNEIYVKCYNKCMDKVIIDKCIICDGIIGSICVNNNYYERCYDCQGTICMLCVDGIRSGDLSNVCAVEPHLVVAHETI